jgi:hypothetical protein
MKDSLPSGKHDQPSDLATSPSACPEFDSIVLQHRHRHKPDGMWMKFFATIVAKHDQQSAVLQADIMQDLTRVKYFQRHSCKRAHGAYAYTHTPERKRCPINTFNHSEF